jgi:acyl transferase domain-containing protein/acyl carrier protein
MGVFTGQGSQWAGMGKDLIDRSPYAIEILAKLDGYLSSLPEDDRPSWTLRDELTISSSRSRVNEAVISQPLTTAIQILLVDLLDIAGVKLNSVVGHSSGEIAAAYAAGLISSKDAIRVAYYRGLHSRHAAGPDGQAGAMIATALTAEQAIGFCDLPAVEKRIVPAAFTGPSIVTLSGDAEIVDRAMLMLESQNIFVKKLKVEKAYHSFHMLPCIEPYLQSLHQCGVGRLPVIPPFQDSPTWFSSLYPGERLDPSRVLHWSYWAENLRSPVRFSEAITTAISEMGVPDIFLEIGPGAVLKSPVFQIIADSGKNGTIYTGLLNRGSNSIATVSEALGQIWARFGKAAVNFAQYDRTFSHAPKPVLMKALPTYPWLHDKEYWWESRFVRRQSQLDYPPTELLGEEISTGAQHEAKWRRFLRPKNIPWLLDHKLNGVPVFPGAAYIAMAASAARRIFSQHAIEMIEVGDIQFKLPISFSDDIPAVEIVLTVTNIHSTSQSGQADFVVDFCSHQRRDSLMTAALGRLNVQFGTDDDRKYPESMVTCATLTKLDISAFYDTLNKNGYAYTGPFRAITTLQRRLDFSTGTIQFSSSEMIFHPAILDALFHSTFAAQSYPGDSAMLSFRVPSRIRSIKVFPVRCDEMATSGNQAIEFNAARTGPSEYVGLLHAPNGIGTVIQMEGFSTSALRLSSPEDDLKMFSEVVWRSYVRDARSLASDCAISRHESVGAMACERVAFFILRRLNESVSVDEEQRAESSLQYLLQFGRLVVGEALLGLSPHIGLEWFKDTEEMIGNIVAENSDIVDMRLLEALGKAYLQIIRGQIGALSVLTENDMLTELYTNGLGLPEANSALTHVVSQISHRSPNIRILEVGAGTGAVTGRILASATYSSYTFTDISPAFLGPAKEKFKRFANKMTFSALDLDKDFAAQGYEPQSFDVIVASNVLHALDNLNAALSQVRQLLKPGGYLACLELPASCRISNTVIIGGLTGCWAGRRSGRSLTPALTEQQWDFALKEAGFAGVDAISPMEDEFQVSYRLFVAQAIEDRVTALRDPLAHGLSKSDDSLMIIGGNTFGDELYCEDVERTLSPFFRETIRIPTIEILRQHTNIPHAVLCLADIEEPIFENMTVAKWSALQKLLTEATDILWVTTGCKSPTRIKSTYSHMMIGLARSVRMEIRDLRLRFLDIDDLNAVSARTVAQVMLEWRLLGRFAAEGWHDRVLFAHDTELAMENGMLLAQAVVHADEENERYNSQQRHIFKKVRPYDSPIEVSYSSENEVYHIRGAHQTAVATAEGEFVSVTMLYTTMYAIKVKKIGFIFIGVGVCGDGKHVVVLSPTTRSVLRLPRHAVYPISMPIDLGPNHIRIIAAQIVAEYVVGAYQGTGRILVLTSDAICLSQIRKVASEHKRGLVFITSDSAFETPGVAFLHRNVSDTHIRRAVPKDISLVVNLSNQSENEVLFKRVTSVLEPSCAKIKRFESVFRPYAYGHDSIGDFSSGSKALAEVEACLKDFGQASLAMHDSTASKVVSVKDIAHKSPRDAFTVLDWTALDRVPITVQPATTTVRFAPNKTYIIIGSSDLAQSLGEWMVNSGARYIVMTSRNPSVASGWAQDMHSKGAYVDLQSMDVTDSSSVGQVFSSIRSAPNKQGVTAPPIGGVIHLGLSLKDSAFSNMKLEDLRKASDVKTKGSLNLHSHLLKENLDFFILTSSISYIAGNRGQANYNAGNAFMAGLAHYRRNIGLPATVVHLGNVTGVGYITRVTQGSENNKRNLEELTSVESLRKRGAYPVSERDLQQIYAEAVLASPADSGRHPEIITGIRPVEPDMVDGAFWAKLPLFAHLISQGTTTSSTNSATETTRPSLSIRERLAKELFSTETEPTTTATTSSTFPKRPSASSAVLRAVLQQALIDRLSILLQIDVQDIDPETNLLDLGIDSLVATEIGSWAMKELKVQVPQSLIFGGATVGGIAEFVAKRMDGSDLGMERKGKRANGKAEVKGEKATRKA